MSPSARERFWQHSAYAVIGHSAKHPFPLLTYRGLKAKGKAVYAVDPSSPQLDGEQVFSDLKGLMGKVEAVVIEVPADETAAWITGAAEMGVKDVWIHDGSESAEAIAIGKQLGLNVLTGRCAVMYLDEKFPHNFHRWIVRLKGTY